MKFLVMVTYASQGSLESSTGPRLRPRWIEAEDPLRAMDRVTLGPGGYAYVIPESDVSVFHRPQEAPLIRVPPCVQVLP